MSKPTHAKTTQDLASFYRNLVKRLNDDFHPSENYAFSILLAGSLAIFSKFIGQIQEPAKTELKDLSSSQQLHVDILCGLILKFSKRGMDMDQPDIRRELRLILEIMASYSGLVRNRPNLEQSKLLTAMAHLMACVRSLLKYIYQFDWLVSSCLSNIPEIFTLSNPPQSISRADRQFERNSGLSLLLLKTTITDANIGVSNLDIHSTLSSIIRVLRDGMLSFLHYITANFW